MHPSRLLAVLVLAVLTGRAAADLAPPEGTKFVPVTTIVEAEENFPDYVVVSISWKVSFTAPKPPPTPPRTGGKRIGPGKSGGGPPRSTKSKSIPEVLTVAPGQPIKHTLTMHVGRAIYAVPRASYEQFADLEDLSVALQNDAVPGVARHFYRSLSRLYTSDPRDEIVLRYRLQHAPGGGVEFWRMDVAPGLEVGHFETPPEAPRLPRTPMAVAGAAAAVGVILVGLWVVSRSRRITCPPATPAPENASGW